ncbi:MAG: hypothetical protein J5737_06730 [Bacteroidales bacterium]|nr:hypothetical protein [Bacteroidales bacterium]
MNRRIIVLAIALATAVSCEKALEDTSLTIQAGFEEEALPASKTYVQSSGAGTIWWGTTGADKVIYAFDSSGNKKAFTSSSTQAEAVRAFTCSSWSGGDWKFAIWTGKTSDYDNCILSGSVFTGNSLEVKNPQTVSNSKSFDNTANIAVMKPSDGVLRNVFGYLRFNLPVYPGTTDISAIKSVELTTKENVAGNIRISYSGSEPVTSIISNGSKSLTLNTRWKDNGPTGYEAGVVYMVLPAGTYHNAKLTITPFAEMPTSKNAATGETLSVNFSGDLVIERGKYADCGTLPYKEKTPDPVVGWPSDTDAFDYGLDPGDMHKASIATSLFAPYGVKNGTNEERTISSPILVDGITYGGPGMMYFGNRVSSQKVASQWSEEYPDIIPTSCYFSFKVNRPGVLRFYPASGNRDGNAQDGYVVRVPTYYLAAVTTVNGVTSARIIKEVTMTENADGNESANRSDGNIYSDGWQKYWVSMEVTADDIRGIESAATLYLYHRNPKVNTLNVYYWPLEWTNTE